MMTAWDAYCEAMESIAEDFKAGDPWAVDAANGFAQAFAMCREGDNANDFAVCCEVVFRGRN